MDDKTPDIIAWLRSQEGEEWSRENFNGRSLSMYQADGPLMVPGMFTLIRESGTGPRYDGEGLCWGLLPGDEKLAPPKIRAFYERLLRRLRQSEPGLTPEEAEERARWSLHFQYGTAH